MDIAIAWNAATQSGDWSVTGGDLTHDEGLRSAIMVSLLTDRRAEDDDALPDPRETDRRGWWGDLPLEGEPPEDRIGSRLWLLARSKATTDTLRQAQQYAREALAWMTTDGLADTVDATAEWQGTRGEILAFAITITRGTTTTRFDLLWTRELAR